MLLQCQVLKQSNSIFLLQYHHTGMQQHIWMVADKLSVLSEMQNPIPAFLLQAFNCLVTQYMPVRPRIAIIKILTFHTDYINNGLKNKATNQPDSNSPSKCRIFKNITLIKTKKKRKKQLMSQRQLSLLVRHLNCCRLSSAHTLTPFFENYSGVNTILSSRASWSFAMVTCW